MCSARFLWALACSCTSGAVALAAAPEQELELALARRQGLYIRLPVERPELQVKVRGVTLEEIPVEALLMVDAGAGSDLPQRPELALPKVWRVAGAPEADWRRVVAPPTLVPYREEPLGEAAVVTPTPAVVRPAQYRVELEGGWALLVGPSPGTGWWARLADRLGTGWRRLWGRPVPERPPAVAVVMTADDARRALHLFREGLAILVVRGGDESTAASQTPTGP